MTKKLAFTRVWYYRGWCAICRLCPKSTAIAIGFPTWIETMMVVNHHLCHFHYPYYKWATGKNGNACPHRQMKPWYDGSPCPECPSGMVYNG